MFFLVQKTSKLKTKSKLWNDIHYLWTKSTGNPIIKIAILDGKADLEHPSLKTANLTLSYLYDETTFDHSLSHHGTAVTSLIFGQHSGRVKGICPDVSGVVIPLYKKKGEPCSQDRLADAISLAIKEGVNIINISAGEITPINKSSLKLQNAIEHCNDIGIIVVAAVGNNGCSCSQIPASMPYVLAIGAIEENGMPFEFSNYGELYKSEGVLLPFSTLTTAGLDGSYNESCSTSVATPIVSGIIALLLSWQIKLGFPKDGVSAKNAIVASSLPCNINKDYCDKYLKGILDIGRTAKLLKLEKDLFKDINNAAKEQMDANNKPLAELNKILS